LGKQLGQINLLDSYLFPNLLTRSKNRLYSTLESWLPLLRELFRTRCCYSVWKRLFS